jgi:hypothetical protein
MAVDRAAEHRKASAKRQRLRYRRRVLGISLFTLALDEHAIIDRLIDAGFLQENESADRGSVEAALAQLVEESLTREDARAQTSAKTLP